MSLTIRQSATAIGPGSPASFMATGGVEPYLYEVLPGGAGGSINASSGAFIGPSSVSPNPRLRFTTIRVTDYANATATAQIMIGTPLLLLCEIIQRELNLADGRVVIWDQKVNMPTDADLWVAVSIASAKPFANVNRQASSGESMDENQYVSMYAMVDIDIMSRSQSALYRKEEIILALNSIYAQQQQERNGFYIGKLPPGGRFINISNIDGAAIPYRFRISVALQYCYTKSKEIDFYDTFSDLDITIDPTPEEEEP